MQKRSAGILMHISSLPSRYGIGDLGPAAKDFADFLFKSAQSIWQVLPLNPTSSSQGYSPYSSTSSMAGNALFISPDILKEDGLLTQDDMEALEDLLTDGSFENVETGKKRMLHKAYDNYRLTETPAIRKDFRDFCEKEKYWLNDYALYRLIRNQQNNAPWYDWPTEFRERKTNTLIRFAEDHHDQMEEVKFEQLLFHMQWYTLREYCKTLNIQLLGDLPIYVGYDSVDVWSHRNIFSLDKNANRIKIAGVPPDAFNSNGQLWGMPVFKWDVLKERNYDWWINRLNKNLEWFDEVRLDHFRAFSAYWEVDAEDDTAINGKWVEGPGAEFFQVIKKELGDLPFVAEDLGEIDQPVYDLRDEFELPGMNVLQFAFGDNMVESTYIPHHHTRNSVVYTGTHDNNTTLGWFKSLSRKEKKNLTLYAGQKVNRWNVNKILHRMAYGSVAARAIIPMQDVLCLDEQARMNMPSSAEGNWKWKMANDAIDHSTIRFLREWCELYDRSPFRKPAKAEARLAG